MKLFILGITGGTGRALAEQALSAGDQVTALARNPTAVKLTHPALSIVHGDATRQEDLESYLPGHDAVLSAIGARTFQATTVYSASGNALVRAMRTVKVRRLIAVTSSGVVSSGTQPVWYRYFLKPLLLRGVYDDMIRFEGMLAMVDDLEWTVVRPPRLVGGSKTGRYRGSLDPSDGPGRLRRADLADFMLRELREPRYTHEVVFVDER